MDHSDATRNRLVEATRWADACLTANLGNTPFYDGLFLTAKSRSLAWQSYLDESSSDIASKTTEMADQAFREAGFERFRPHVCAVRIEIIEIEARTNMLGSVDDVTEIERQLRIAQRISRHGPLAYMNLRVADAAVHAFAAMRMKPSDEMMHYFRSILRDARRTNFGHRADSISANLSQLS